MYSMTTRVNTAVWYIGNYKVKRVDPKFSSQGEFFFIEAVWDDVK